MKTDCCTQIEKKTETEYPERPVVPKIIFDIAMKSLSQTALELETLKAVQRVEQLRADLQPREPTLEEVCLAVLDAPR